MTRIAIIGAGLAGITLARNLQTQADVTVFEKSRGIGGRMATRYAGDYEFDHGAQFFTVKSDAFDAALYDYKSAGHVRDWPVEVEVIGGARETSANRLVAAPRMNALCKAMAEGLNVQVKTQIAGLTETDKGWLLSDINSTDHGPFEWVISAAPAPQAITLLPASFNGHTALASVVMQGCFALMLGFENPVELPWPAARIQGSPVGWITVNSDKPGRQTGTSVLIQSSNEWAEANLEEDKAIVQATLLQAATALTGVDLFAAPHIALHRWRYAATPVPCDEAFLLDKRQKLAACGDWCVGSRVESAFTSANNLSERLIELI